MGSVQMSKDEMEKRVARFKDLRPSTKAFVDSLIPGHEREIFNIIGRGVTEDSSLRPAIADARDFNLTLVHAEPGKGAALHAHPTVEVFMSLSGRWAVCWGESTRWRWMRSSSVSPSSISMAMNSSPALSPIS